VAAPRRRGPRRASLLAVLLLAAASAAADLAADRARDVAELRVERVVDGDSVVLADGRQVRYVGINAPEAGEPFSKKARELNRRLVEGHVVRVVRARPRPDRYGRTLADVYAGERFVNAELLRAGMAHLFLFEPVSQEAALIAAENEARQARRGLWGRGGLTGPLRITAPRRWRAEDRTGRPLEAITIANVASRPTDLGGHVLEVGGSRFALPAATLGRGRVALVLMRKGRDRVDGPGPLRFHWPGPRRPGTLVLRDSAGAVVDRVVLSAPSG
jgi:endonuclease YncB( thermonuclease family)